MLKLFTSLCLKNFTSYYYIISVSLFSFCNACFNTLLYYLMFTIYKQFYNIAWDLGIYISDNSKFHYHADRVWFITYSKIDLFEGASKRDILAFSVVYIKLTFDATLSIVWRCETLYIRLTLIKLKKKHNNFTSVLNFSIF